LNISGLQSRIGTTPDGKWGPNSSAALLAHFTNLAAPAVSPEDIAAYAARLGCKIKQLNAVAKVESAGGGFDKTGKPKILFERHWFHRLTKGKWSVAPFSNPSPGGYGESSWRKLEAACAHDPDAAFSSVSWGKFQILGAHWSRLGYQSAYAMAWTSAQSEGDHYEMLVRYIEEFRLQKALQALSDNPSDCVEFASRYNGPAFRVNRYDEKLAEAMQGDR